MDAHTRSDYLSCGCTAFHGVCKFLKKWVAANAPDSSGSFPGRPLFGVLENVEGLSDARNDEDGDSNDVGTSDDESLDFSNSEYEPDQLTTHSKKAVARKSALHDCKLVLEGLGFVCTIYKMDPRRWNYPQSRKRWCLV